jgi:predicted site-specific integrase-resolvase
MINKQLLSTKDIEQLFGVTKHTIMLWRNNGILPYTRLNDRKFLYKKEDIEKLLQIEIPKTDNKQNIIYCRVSNQKQKDDLQKQRQLLIDYCNSQGIIPDLVLSEIASGMNENRIEFNKLIDMVINNQINKIYITYKDRLTRFGFDYFKNLFEKFNAEIIILNNPINENNMEQELTEDLINIIHHFSMKMYSNRRKQLKEIQKQLEQ